jgi:hypothetical protein
MSLFEVPAEALAGLPHDPAQLLGGLTALLVHCIVGVALGELVARAMRSRRLHWSWSACVLAFLLLSRWVLTGAGMTVAVAALRAARTGRRWQREDQEAGADLAQLAGAACSPASALGRLTRAMRDRLERAAGAQRWVRCGQLALGRDERGRAVSAPFAPGSGGHTLVVGATGSGKTVTQTWIAVRTIEHGAAAIVIDPKGDDGMRAEVERAAREAGAAYLRWSPHGPSIYNPYARGSETEIADRILAGERFTEPHYLRQAQRYLGHAVRALRGSGVETSLQSIVEHLDPGRLEVLSRTLEESAAAATQAYLDSLTARQRGDLAGVRDRLAILAESDVGPWLDPCTPGRRCELLDAVSSHAVVYFSLEADARPLLTQMLGAAIVQDLLTTVAALQGRPARALVVIDEFSAVAADQVVRLFGRARSAGVSLLLGTQELSDLRLPTSERLLERVMGNLSLLVAHRQVVPRSAELIAAVAGTKGAWKVTRHSDGRTMRTRMREPVLDPSQIMGLAPGWAAVVPVAGEGPARIARIHQVEPQAWEVREDARDRR